jgi:hypothetical protein
MALQFALLNECAKKLEHIWTVREMMKLFTFVSIGCGLWVMAVHFTFFKITGDAEYL